MALDSRVTPPSHGQDTVDGQSPLWMTVSSGRVATESSFSSDSRVRTWFRVWNDPIALAPAGYLPVPHTDDSEDVTVSARVALLSGFLSAAGLQALRRKLGPRTELGSGPPVGDFPELSARSEQLDLQFFCQSSFPSRPSIANFGYDGYPSTLI